MQFNPEYFTFNLVYVFFPDAQINNKVWKSFHYPHIWSRNPSFRTALVTKIVLPQSDVIQSSSHRSNRKHLPLFNVHFTGLLTLRIPIQSQTFSCLKIPLYWSCHGNTFQYQWFLVEQNPELSNIDRTGINFRGEDIKTLLIMFVQQSRGWA